ncbi:DUF3800 domain-containing protein [Pedobacter endophyticus]|uniref:DUF3800 domain-containing protein n=1 Tax=Pedobacter endophyticus TaxID=2789740 RepID=A0A7S9L203_9SPHI|nr:DUF3800 domain-containing protein [Pedobacter endophyticus]QPH41020.1 DUF3800 domain-containing protein [Pedobacter endophyticus]
MSIFFGFSDECGAYQTEKTIKHVAVHPYYIRCTLIIKADDWKKINTLFRDLKVEYDLPLEREIKWAYLWQLRKFQKEKKEIPKNKDFKFLEHHSYKSLIEFVDSSLSLLNYIDYKKIIITHTENRTCPKINEKAMLKMHLQEHMQRVEMETQARDGQNLAVMFFDPVCENTDKYLRDIYFDLFSSGDFISSYKHIKDSLNIEYSHQSVGIQLTDFISGAFSSILKGLKSNNYEMGKIMFYDYIYPNLRCHKQTVWGAGIREVPSDMCYRNKLTKELLADLEKMKRNRD